MDKICKICSIEFPSYATLHKHISFREKIKIADYYQKFYPRFDLFTNEPITFKDIEQYFSTFFLSRGNLVKWFEKNYEQENAKELSKKIINNRILNKNIKYLFSEVELRSIIAPSIVGLEKIHNKKYEDIITFPLKKKFKYSNIELKPINCSLEVVIDTREQQPFTFKKHNTNLAKLDVGDYTAAEPLYNDIYIERKSREDFFGTFGQENGVKRFEKELIRAQNYGFYLFVLIEKDISECLNYFLSFSSNQYLVEYAFFNMRNLIQKYDNCQFVFGQNKTSAENLCLQILSNPEVATQYDWQYLLDKRII